MNNKIKDAAEFIVANHNPYIQIFDTRNIVGDPMETEYQKNGITIDYCYSYDYLEVFGLSDSEYQELLETINDIALYNKGEEVTKKYWKERRETLLAKYKDFSREQLLEELVSREISQEICEEG